MTSDEARIVEWWLSDSRLMPAKDETMLLSVYDAGFAARCERRGLITLNVKGDGVVHVNRTAYVRALNEYRSKAGRF